MRRQLHHLVAVLLALVFVGAACSSSDPTSTGSGTTTTAASTGSTTGTGRATGSATGTITVSAATSLTEPFKKIGDEFEKANPGVTDVTFNFDSSGTLSKQIQDLSLIHI